MSAAIQAQRDALLAAARKVDQAEKTATDLLEFDTLFDAAMVELRAAIALADDASIALPPEAAAIGAALDCSSLEQGEPA